MLFRSTNGGTLQGTTWNGVVNLSNQNFVNYCVRMADITDGTSNTAMVGEVTVSLSVSNVNSNSNVFPAWAGGPGNNPGGITLTNANGNQGDACGSTQALGSVFRFMDGNYPLNSPKTVAASDNSFGSQHGGGANILFADGTVHFITSTIDAFTYQAIGSINGKETVSAQW